MMMKLLRIRELFLLETFELGYKKMEIVNPAGERVVGSFG